MKIDLTGKVALVTGASRGIGKAIATGLAEAGATVAVHYNANVLQAEAVALELGQRACAFQADLASVQACEILVADVISEYGCIDVLVNNAGIARFVDAAAPTDTWLKAWEQTMAVNARAPELLCRLVIQHYQSRGQGRIINIASRAAFRGDTAEYMTYAASKGAVVSLTRSVARAYGKDGITAFVVAPGFVRTDMAQDAIDSYGEAFVVQDLALNSLTESGDIAPIVVLLASGLADHATGTSIDVNAGSYVH